ncbi:hypothetical protein V8C37DRAFT_368433 [Trichoderma ceciliae]
MAEKLKSLKSIFLVKRYSAAEKEDASYSSSEEYEDQDKPLMGTTQEAGYITGRPRSRIPRFLVISCPLLTIISSLLVVLVIAVIVISLSSPTIITKTLTQFNPTTTGVMVKPCGSTPDEARSRGCHFDVISFCWLPSQCYDSLLSEDFDSMNHLEWYLDPNRTQPLTHDQIMTGEYTGLYVNWEYHVRHCTAMWKKMHRAFMGEGRKAVDGYIASYAHTKHCEHMLLSSNIAYEVINTRIAVKYPDCGM